MTNTAVSYTHSYPALPESVPAARAELADFAAQAGAQGECLEAIRLAASEAVTNAVLHAYGESSDGKQAVKICASLIPDGLWVLVSDDGSWRAQQVRSGLGLGLGLIAQLADEFELAGRSRGTELRMRFCITQTASESCSSRAPAG